jgi:hypothetical protein
MHKIKLAQAASTGVKSALRLQKCLQEEDYQQWACQDVIDRLYLCCETHKVFGRSPNCAGLPKRADPHQGSFKEPSSADLETTINSTIVEPGDVSPERSTAPTAASRPSPHLKTPAVSATQDRASEDTGSE